MANFPADTANPVKRAPNVSKRFTDEGKVSCWTVPFDVAAGVSYKHMHACLKPFVPHMNLKRSCK